METVLKTVGARKALVGSNPTPAALISHGVQQIRSRVPFPDFTWIPPAAPFHELQPSRAVRKALPEVNIALRHWLAPK